MGLNQSGRARRRHELHHITDNWLHSQWMVRLVGIVQIDDFLHYLAKFHAEFGHDLSPEARTAKLTEEVCEYLEADQISTKEHADDEAIDVLITSLSNVYFGRGIKDPLHACFAKLERSAEKYRKQGVANVNQSEVLSNNFNIS